MSGDLPKGPLLALISGSVLPGQKLCGAFQLDASVDADKRICCCGASAHEHGMEPLSGHAWGKVYERLAAQNDKLTNKSKRRGKRDDDNRPIPNVKPIKAVEKGFDEPWESTASEIGADKELIEPRPDVEEDDDEDEEDSLPLKYPDWEEQASTFTAMGLNEDLIKSLKQHGTQEPTKLQKRIVAPIVQRKNTLVKCIPGRENLVAISMAAVAAVKVDSPPTLQVLIINSSHEAAQITYDTITAISKDLGIVAAQVVGGNKRENVRKTRLEVKSAAETAAQMTTQLGAGVHIIVATTGRLYDAFQNKLVPPNEVKYLIIAGADGVLRLPFNRGHVSDMIGALPKEVAVSMLFQRNSKGIEKLIKKYVSDPVQVIEEPSCSPSITHSYVQCHPKNKFDTLVGMGLDGVQGSIVIFCRPVTVMTLLQILEIQQWPVVAVTIAMEHGEREKSYKAWEQGFAPILLTSDTNLEALTGRADLVINVETFHEVNRYIARCNVCKEGGRTVSFISEENRRHLRKIKTAIVGTAVVNEESAKANVAESD